MSFKGEIFRVLIASPSDLEEERQVATDAVNEWNATHSRAESVVLLPVKWETHSVPETGVRLQGALNKQFVDDCDILVGMFWTRLGTHTGVAESGTIEEIDRFTSAGKPAMLYFSRRLIDPTTIDLKQHEKLREFKSATQRTAITGTFSDTDELRALLGRHLMAQVRKLKSGSSSDLPVARLAELGWTVRPGKDHIVFEVAGSSLPSMRESSTYFAQLDKQFGLHFQSVKGLEGLHYSADIAGCTSIAISAGEFTDISELRGFSHLTKLGISQVPLNGLGVVDPSPLSSLSGLRELNLNMTRVRTADFVASLTNLTKLYLGQTLITDISSVSKLASLEYLVIRGTRVTDLRSLSQNENLAELEIGGEQIPGLLHLGDLQNLSKLTIIEQRNADLSPISILPNLEHLSIWGLPNFDLSPLRQLLKLHVLQLSGLGGLGFNTVSAVTDIVAISVLKDVKTLTLGSLQVNDLGFVENLKSLEEINLSHLPITSVAPLSGLTSLKKISLTQTPVVDVSPLLNLPTLNELAVIRTPARADILTELERRGVKVTR
jgi:hypothetical protein